MNSIGKIRDRAARKIATKIFFSLKRRKRKNGTIDRRKYNIINLTYEFDMKLMFPQKVALISLLH
jgi:hypothetical protein